MMATTEPIEQLASRYFRSGGRLPMGPRDAHIPLVKEDNGWYKAQFGLKFDDVPLSKTVETWLSKVRGALRDPAMRVLIYGCQKRNIDPGGQFGLAEHPRIVWWENGQQSSDKYATKAIPQQIGFVTGMRFMGHSLTDSIFAKARARNIPFTPPIAGHDVKALVQLGLMNETELERRLRPIIPSAIRALMNAGSPTANATTAVMLDGQIHKLVKGDELPKPLEPDTTPTTGDLMAKAAKVVVEKKKRVILNPAMGPVQKVLQQHPKVALDESLSYTERARQLIDACRDAGLTETSIASLALAVGGWQKRTKLEAAKLEAAKAAKDAQAALPSPVEKATAPEPPAAIVPQVETTAIARPKLASAGAVQRIIDSVAEGRRLFKEAEDLARKAADTYALGGGAFDDVEKELANLDTDLRQRALRALQAEFQL
jgi:hypothetical protein